MTPLEKRNLKLGLLFCTPWLIGIGTFLLYPIVSAVIYSLCDYSVLLPPVYIGTENYRELFTDPLVYKSLWNTVVYATGSVFLSSLVSLTLALLLNTKVRGLGFYRTVFFLPSLMPVVAGSVLFMWLFNGHSGLINAFLAILGVNGPAWLADPRFAKLAMILMATWGSGHAMVIVLAGLQDVPTALHEAAIIDGATYWDRLWHVTLPMLSPVLYFNVIMGIIGGFQVFTQAFIMTDATGSPERSTLFFVLHLFNVAFQDLRMGYACALACMLFLIILSLTWVLTKVSARFIVYDR